RFERQIPNTRKIRWYRQAIQILARHKPQFLSLATLDRLLFVEQTPKKSNLMPRRILYFFRAINGYQMQLCAVVERFFDKFAMRTSLQCFIGINVATWKYPQTGVLNLWDVVA